MRWYLDASVALYAILPVDEPRVHAWLDAVGSRGDQVLSSTLLELELTRTLRREGLNPARARAVLKRLDLVSINDGVLRVAASIETPVKSLDAIHLATCSLLGAGVTLVTHDAKMAAAAASLGIDALDPLAPR
ncbi:MAG: PIN domain-containing protein [Gemmatimonadales bacterium]|nr:PIN domain-containing protein [Gemmatimonadales bacterium]